MDVTLIHVDVMLTLVAVDKLILRAESLAPFKKQDRDPDSARFALPAQGWNDIHAMRGKIS